MSRTLELPEAIYAALHQAAEASGMSPAAWIAAHLPGLAPVASPPGTLADELAGRTGVIGSGGRDGLSKETGEKFADYLEAKRRAGRL